MTAEQITLVQQSWHYVFNVSDEIGEAFYENLFEKAPHLRTLFHESHKVQAHKFMTLLSMMVSKLHLETEPDEMISSLGKRHTAYGVKEEYFQVFGDVLIETLQTQLADKWNDELTQAWQMAYNQMAKLMKVGGHIV